MSGISAKSAGKPENKFKYNGNEIQNREFSDGSGLNAMDFNARTYEPQLGRFWQLDPIVKVNESPYSWNTNNPILFADPDGRDSVQRAKALQKAKEYVDKKEEGNQYLMAAKGDPGEQVDCSGLVSKCVQAGGEKDPNHGDKSSGVLNIQDNTTKLADEKVQPGNIVTFKFDKGYPYHTGIILSTVKDKNGNIMKFVMINSVSGTGPKEQTVTIGEGKLGNGVSGYYKWDTKPDKQVSMSKSNGQTSIRQNQVDWHAPTSIMDAVPALKFGFW
jgi:RHS repeat-associated protein